MDAAMTRMPTKRSSSLGKLAIDCDMPTMPSSDSTLHKRTSEIRKSTLSSSTVNQRRTSTVTPAEQSVDDDGDVDDSGVDEVEEFIRRTSAVLSREMFDIFRKYVAKASTKSSVDGDVSSNRKLRPSAHGNSNNANAALSSDSTRSSGVVRQRNDSSGDTDRKRKDGDRTATESKWPYRPPIAQGCRIKDDKRLSFDLKTDKSNSFDHAMYLKSSPSVPSFDQWDNCNKSNAACFGGVCKLRTNPSPRSAPSIRSVYGGERRPWLHPTADQETFDADDQRSFYDGANFDYASMPIENSRIRPWAVDAGTGWDNTMSPADRWTVLADLTSRDRGQGLRRLHRSEDSDGNRYSSGTPADSLSMHGGVSDRLERFSSANNETAAAGYFNMPLSSLYQRRFAWQSDTFEDTHQRQSPSSYDGGHTRSYQPERLSTYSYHGSRADDDFIGRGDDNRRQQLGPRMSVVHGADRRASTQRYDGTQLYDNVRPVVGADLPVKQSSAVACELEKIRKRIQERRFGATCT